MPITINGDGTITGYTPPIADGSITSAKLANGAVGTTQLADNSVTHAKTTGLQRRITSSAISLSGAGDHTFNITSGVRQIDIIFENASSNNNSNMLLYLGDAGGTESSGYGYASGFHRGSSTGREGTVTNFTSSFETYGLDSASYQIWGVWKLWNPTGNTWVAEHIFWGSAATNHTFYGNGYKILSDTITKFNIAVKNGQFDTGTMTVIQTMGDD